MGNCRSDEEFFEHFRFLIRELYRVIMPGRLVSFHCMNLPTSKAHHGYIGIRDFRGELIRAFEAEGWIYHSEVCIWKDPVVAQQRTKALGLLHKQVVKDSAMSRQGIPDYLVTMRKPGVNPEPISGEFEEFIGEGLDVSREAYERQQEEIRRLEDYVRRNIAGQKSRSAESRRKVLERMERLERPVTDRRRPGLRFEPAAASGREVLALRNVGVAFADPADPGRAPRWLFGDVSAEVRRGERVALVGRNGAGKSTLLEVIAGLRPPTTGEVVRGAGVRPAYLPQDPPEPVGSTVLEEVLARTGLDLPSARALLGRFLFVGDDVSCPVGALSRGERTRLALASLVAAMPNLLILDEPTGHLDLPSREVLEQALASFPGTLLVVSHDRYFLQKVATRVWELDGGRLVDFPGPYDEYRRWRLSRAEMSETVPRVRASEGAAAPASGPRPTPQLSKGRRARIEAELWGVLEEIDRLERRRSELEARLADPETYRSGAGAATAAEYRDTQARLEEADRRWAELTAALEPPGPAGPDPRG
ncbi:MAG: ATP-binding cassette domain-containing protein [Firmicutes bacterium]|nr:ATP-binding cassette domain-containing protein [Bacillota bacterium]